MVKLDDSETAVIGKVGDSAVEVDSRQLMAMTYIDGIIKEDGANDEMPAVSTHRSAPSVSMMAGSKVLQAPLSIM